MDQKVLKRYLDICDRARYDKEYLRVYEEYHEAQKQFLILVEKMDPVQQDTVFAYIGACSDLHLRLMELACQ